MSLLHWLPVIPGVPGSILGRLSISFILYANDVISHFSLKMFADDLTLYQNITNFVDCELLQWILGGYMSEP